MEPTKINREIGKTRKNIEPGCEEESRVRSLRGGGASRYSAGEMAQVTPDTGGGANENFCNNKKKKTPTTPEPGGQKNS